MKPEDIQLIASRLATYLLWLVYKHTGSYLLIEVLNFSICKQKQLNQMISLVFSPDEDHLILRKALCNMIFQC